MQFTECNWTLCFLDIHDHALITHENDWSNLLLQSNKLRKIPSPVPVTNLNSSSILTKQTETERGQTHNQDDGLLSSSLPLFLPFSPSLSLSHMEDLDVKEQLYWNSGQTSGNQSESEGCNYQTEMALRESVPVRMRARTHTHTHTLADALIHKQNWLASEQHTFTDIYTHREGRKDI